MMLRECVGIRNGSTLLLPNAEDLINQKGCAPKSQGLNRFAFEKIAYLLTRSQRVGTKLHRKLGGFLPGSTRGDIKRSFALRSVREALPKKIALNLAQQISDFLEHTLDQVTPFMLLFF